ncbi:MAG: hypothetical protein GY742_01330 [Hyphomicrobiales bacterium]|nr:hypothetical protein [Hyphomicrobiales bacterium]
MYLNKLSDFLCNKSGNVAIIFSLLAFPIANTVAEVIAAEAGGRTRAERVAEMRAIASVIDNRSRFTGVTHSQVVGMTDQFNSYSKAMPPGTAALAGMAQDAMDYVATHGSTVGESVFFSTPATQGNLPSGRKTEATLVNGHIYASDPKGRSIKTTLGYIKPVSAQAPVQTTIQTGLR